MVAKRQCSFCAEEIEPGTGMTFVKRDGTVFQFCSSSCRKQQLGLGRIGHRLKWTRAYALKKAAERSTAARAPPAAPAPTPKSPRRSRAPAPASGSAAAPTAPPVAAEAAAAPAAKAPRARAPPSAKPAKSRAKIPSKSSGAAKQPDVEPGEQS